MALLIEKVADPWYSTITHIINLQMAAYSYSAFNDFAPTSVSETNKKMS